MAEEKRFRSITTMYNFIVQDWAPYGNPFSGRDLSIGKNIGKDNRIDWKETRHVCTRRMYDEVYDVPQCIGMCSIEDVKLLDILNICALMTAERRSSKPYRKFKFWHNLHKKIKDDIKK